MGQSPRKTKNAFRKRRRTVNLLWSNFQTLTRASTLSWCLCSKVARSTCPSSVGSRLMSSGWIFSSRALTSHSCLCFALRYGFASRPSKLGSPAPVNVNTGQRSKVLMHRLLRVKLHIGSSYSLFYPSGNAHENQAEPVSSNHSQLLILTQFYSVQSCCSGYL